MKTKKSLSDIVKLKISEPIYKINLSTLMNSRADVILYFRVREDGAILASMHKDTADLLNRGNQFIYKFSGSEMKGLPYGIRGTLSKKRAPEGTSVMLTTSTGPFSSTSPKIMVLMNPMDVKLIRATRLSTLKKNNWKAI